MACQGRIYGEFADSRWYAEPKRLERLVIRSRASHAEWLDEVEQALRPRRRPRRPGATRSQP